MLLTFGVLDWIALGLFCIVLILTVVTVILLIIANKCKGNKVTYYADVVDICKQESMSPNNTYDVIFPIVEYEVNGKVYRNKVSYFKKCKIGDSVLIWYDKTNPDKVTTKGGVFVPPIIVSIIDFCFIVAFLIVQFINR